MIDFASAMPLTSIWSINKISRWHTINWIAKISHSYFPCKSGPTKHCVCTLKHTHSEILLTLVVPSRVTSFNCFGNFFFSRKFIRTTMTKMSSPKSGRLYLSFKWQFLFVSKTQVQTSTFCAGHFCHCCPDKLSWKKKIPKAIKWCDSGRDHQS